MATLEDIVAATRFLAKESETTPLTARSGSNGRARASDVKKVDGSASAAVKTFSSVSNGGTSVSVNGRSDGVSDGKIIDSQPLTESGKKGSTRDRIDDEQEDSGGSFQVGDFVWAKIRSHAWWPGQVYDPRDASEFAEKLSQDGRLLVAFFGDGSCSWCTPSQLIPFVENFEHTLNSSSSKSFLNAVGMALDEIRRLVELEMSCKCIPEEIKNSLSRPVASNSGVRNGVLMPQVDVRRLFLAKCEPTELFAKLRNFAEDVSFVSTFELAVFTSWISAFYRFKRGYSLSRYHDPYHIEGLGDESKDVAAVTNNFIVPNEVHLKGPHSDDKIYQRRKQKSVAALMRENADAKPHSRERVTVHEGDDLGRSRSSRKRKNSGDGEEGAHEMDASTGKSSRRKKVEVPVSTKLSSEEVLNGEKGSFKGADRANKGVDKVSLIRKRRKIKVSSGEAKEESEWITTPRERKKSKYLSLPYMNVARRADHTSLEMEAKIESYKITKVARVGERISKAAENLFTPPLSKVADGVSEEKLSYENHEKLDKSDDASCCKENDKLIFSMPDVNSPVNVILSEIQSTALYPLQLNKGGSLDIVRAFISALRSSTYKEGSNYSLYEKFKNRNKKKSPPSQLRNLGNNHIQEKLKSSVPKCSKNVVLKAEGNSGRSKSKCKKAEETCGEKSSAWKVEENDVTRLILTFIPEYPLPSKKDICRIFSKFGSLNKKETNVYSDSRSAQVVYVADSDAEAAFESSLSQSPFSKNVNYRLQHSSNESRSRGSRERVSSPPKPIPENVGSSKPLDGLMIEVSVVKQKFEIMAAILENYHPKFSPEEKCSLKDEMKRLMETVETSSEKVRIVAERTKS